jgi:hypothetical protein
LVIEAILCNGDNDAAISSADPGGGPVDGNKVEPGLLPEIYGLNNPLNERIILPFQGCVKLRC